MGMEQLSFYTCVALPTVYAPPILLSLETPCRSWCNELKMPATSWMLHFASPLDFFGNQNTAPALETPIQQTNASRLRPRANKRLKSENMQAMKSIFEL